MAVPDRPVEFIPAKKGDVLVLGNNKIRILEDGSNTDMRLSTMEVTLPPYSRGPPPHWHEMHDETFFVLSGSVKFHIPGKPDLDARTNDYVVVPTKSPHTFSNPYETEARMFFTCSPAFYVNYFKMLSEMIEDGEPLTPELNVKAMNYFATLPVAEP